MLYEWMLLLLLGFLDVLRLTVLLLGNFAMALRNSRGVVWLSCLVRVAMFAVEVFLCGSCVVG